MVAAGIMCQIYSMKGLLRKLSLGKNVRKSKSKNKKRTPHPLFFFLSHPRKRLFESTLEAHSDVSVYHPSSCQNLLFLNPFLLLTFLLATSLLLTFHLQYLNVRVTCQFSNEGVDINP